MSAISRFRFMQQRTVAIVLSIAGLVATAQAAAPPAPDVAGTAWILVDHDSGQVLAGKQPDARVEPASITKIMTAYVIFKEINSKKLRLDDLVTISEKAWKSEGSRTFLKVGSKVSVEVLLKGMIVQSGNDAAIALSERVAGTEAAFASMMNTEGKRLGLSGTHFTNPDGLPDVQHYTTPRDIAMLSRALIKDFPDFYKWYGLREFTWGGITQPNRNGLLSRDPSVDGIKTGHTDSAGYCLASSALRDRTRLIAAVFGTASMKERETASAALLNYGFTFFEAVHLRNRGDIILKPRLYKGISEFIDVAPIKDIAVVVPRGAAGSVKLSTTLREPLIAPLAAGTVVGEAIVTHDKQVIARIPLVITRAAEGAGIFRRLVDTVALWVR